jgi:hypothetical protein
MAKANTAVPNLDHLEPRTQHTHRLTEYERVERRALRAGRLLERRMAAELLARELAEADAKAEAELARFTAELDAQARRIASRAAARRAALKRCTLVRSSGQPSADAGRPATAPSPRQPSPTHSSPSPKPKLQPKPNTLRHTPFAKLEAMVLPPHSDTDYVHTLVAALLGVELDNPVLTSRRASRKASRNPSPSQPS